jgi:hypothetical protein
MNHVLLVLRLYTAPLKSFSRIIDEGRLLFAVLSALAVVIALQAPRSFDSYSEAPRHEARAKAARTAAEAARQPQAGESEDEDDESPAQGAVPVRPQGLAALQALVERFTLQTPGQYLSPLLALAICFVPVTILVVTIWDNLGGFGTILFRDYTTLLVCFLLAWAAAYLPLAIVNGALLVFNLPWHDQPVLWWAAHAYFLVLAVMAVRTVCGVPFGHAAGAACAAWAAAVGGLGVSSLAGGFAGYLASPFVLFYLYYAFRGMGSEFSSLGAGLRSRQHLKKQLEIATLNPRDADAHYQLGLIYQQRRQNELAAACFRKAIAVDPTEADPHFQLGRMAREEGRYDAALEELRSAARIDDKHAMSEVWREVGATSLLAGNHAGAVEALEKYLARRPYDPEGNCWYGRALRSVGRTEEARAAFEQAIEAVRTMPPARKRQVRSWESESRQELKKIPAAAH